MVRKRSDEQHLTRLPFPRLVLQPGIAQEICASPQRELRGPYQLVFWGHDLSNVQLEEMLIGQELCGAALGQSAMPLQAFERRKLCGPCTTLGTQIRLRLRNAGVCTQEVQTVLLAEFIPDELRGLGCSYHRHEVRGCHACREKARLRRSHSFSNTLDVAQRPTATRIREAERGLRRLLDFKPTDDVEPSHGDEMLSDDLFGYDPGPDELDPLGLHRYGRRQLGTHGPFRSAAAARQLLYPQDAMSRRAQAFDVIVGGMKHLADEQLHELAAKLLIEMNLRNEAKGLGRVKFAPDVPPVLINPLPPGGIVRHCLNCEVGACGVCSLCVGKAQLHVREEPPPAPPPPPPREVPPAKGPEFDRSGFEKEPAHDAPPTQPRLREVDTLEMTSDHPTATPTRAALRKLEENRYAALVSEFEAWESPGDEYP